MDLLASCRCEGDVWGREDGVGGRRKGVREGGREGKSKHPQVQACAGTADHLLSCLSPSPATKPPTDPTPLTPVF